MKQMTVRQIIERIPKYIYSHIDHFFVYKVAKVSPTLATRFHYRKVMGGVLDLRNPRKLNDKLQWLKLHTYYNNAIVKKCADKYAVRGYVKDKGCEEILNELYGVWDSPDDIDWAMLPNQFVLKCNHGSGYNLVCKDKSQLDIHETKKLLQKWLKEDYGLANVELIYDGIPHKIICEKYIEPEDGIAPRDIKIFCSYGEPKLIYIMLGNDDYQDFFTPEWEWIPVKNGLRPNASITPKRPDNLDALLEYSHILSKDFPLVRVDFYNEIDKSKTYRVNKRELADKGTDGKNE